MLNFGDGFVTNKLNRYEKDINTSMQELEKLLSGVKQGGYEEAVPEHMLQLFDEEQWPDLILEFQPSLATFSANCDVVSIHRANAHGVKPDTRLTLQTLHWVIFKDGDSVVIRKAEEIEMKAISLARTKMCLSRIASVLWPGCELIAQKNSLNEMLQCWMREELIIDIGVPLPEDAEFAL